jgi:hypothetical protein
MTSSYEENIIYNYMASKEGLVVDIHHARKAKKPPTIPSEDD